MQFDQFVNLCNPEQRDYSVVMEEFADLAEECEELGFGTLWTAEHHFGGEGYDVQPNPILSSVFLASRTTTLRLGLAAVVLPEWHPLRLAEDIAVLDHLAGGRIEVGVARGITDRELSNLNPFRVERRFESNRRVFEETLAILRRAWSDDTFTWDGEYYTFPRRGVSDSYAGWYPRNPAWRSDDGEYVGMSIVPKPKQAVLPLWNVGDSDSSLQFAAREGMNAITWLRSDRSLRPGFDAYADAWEARFGQRPPLGDQLALMRVCYVADTDEEARRIAEPGIERIFRDYLGGLRGRQIYADPGEVLGADVDKMSWYDFLDARGHLLVGSPETIRRRLEGYQHDVQLRRLIGYTWLPGLTYKEIAASIELFGREVMPKFAANSFDALETVGQRNIG